MTAIIGWSLLALIALGGGGFAVYWFGIRKSKATPTDSIFGLTVIWQGTPRDPAKLDRIKAKLHALMTIPTGTTIKVVPAPLVATSSSGVTMPREGVTYASLNEIQIPSGPGDSLGYECAWLVCIQQGMTPVPATVVDEATVATGDSAAGKFIQKGSRIDAEFNVKAGG